MTHPAGGAGSFLGDREVTAALTNAASQFNNPYGVGNWSAVFDPKVLAFSANLVECYHIALHGPAGSSLQLYIDGTFYDATSRGDLNSYDPTHPLLLRGGQSLVFHWNTSASPAPFVTTWWRTPLTAH